MSNLISENEIFFSQFEPILKNRFIMYIDGIPAYIIKKTDRPKLTQGVVRLPHINVDRYVKGKTKWDPMTIMLHDPIVPSGAQAVMEWVRLHHESVTGRDGYADFYKKDIVINALGPVGDKVQEWILKGCVITGADFGDMDWNDEGTSAEITLTLQPDYCILSY